MSREGIIPHFTQHSLDHTNNSAASYGLPRYRKDIYKLGQVRGGSPRRSGLEHLFCEEKLRNEGLFSLGKRLVQGDLTAAPSAYG